MAGRHKIMGSEKCPDINCLGFLELGRTRQKTVRNRQGGRYMKYYYFRHNDSNIAEHYVDNFIRKKTVTNYPGGRYVKYHYVVDNFGPKDNEMEEVYSKTIFNMQKIVERIATFPLTDEESIRWNREKEWVADNVINPIRIMGEAVNNEQLKNSPDFELAKDKFIRAIFGKEFDTWGFDEELFERYDRPVKLERNKKRNKKLSEWHGTRTNDFIGIESESESESIKPKIK